MLRYTITREFFAMAMHTSKSIILLCGMLFVSAARAQTVSLHLGKETVQAEVAATKQSRNHGLMQRKHLCTNCGMLFVFADPARYGFWMKDTEIPLAVAFISADGTILNIAEMQPDTTQPYLPAGEVLYALEMQSGWFTSHAIHPREKVRGLQLAPLGQ